MRMLPEDVVRGRARRRHGRARRWPRTPISRRRAQKVFKRCAVCHKIGEGAKNGAGPSLEGVIGRTAGTEEGFSYSKPMVEAGQAGLVWNDETLFEYLADPKAMVKGTKMVFAGLKSEEDRHAVIAYIEANGG